MVCVFVKLAAEKGTDVFGAGGLERMPLSWKKIDIFLILYILPVRAMSLWVDGG